MKKITNIVREYAAEQAISEEEALQKGMEEKWKDSSRREASEKCCAAKGRRPRLRAQPSQFVEKRAEIYVKA